MEEKKLTAEEIVKKLNYIKEQYLSYIYNDDDECKVLFVDDILDLINRLQTENAEQKKELARLKKFELYRIDEMKKQKTEIERLKIDLANEKNWGKIQTKQAVKDTAKEIWTIVMSDECSVENTFDDTKFTKIIKERYGVEVEE